MINQLMKLLKPIYRQISLIVVKGLINRTNSDPKNGSQLLQVDLGNGRVFDKVERVQPFGLSSNPDAGAQAIVLSLAGNMDHPVIIQVDDNKYRVQVDKGNVAIYNKSGICIHLKEEKILVSKGIAAGEALIPLDGVITGQAIDTFTGMKLGALPGANSLGTANSQKLLVAV